MAKHKSGKNAPKRKDQALDEALEETFPASDPPAMTDPDRHIGTAGKAKGGGKSGRP